MYENDNGRVVALLIIGAYLGAAAVIYFKRQQDWNNAHCEAVANVERRVLNLENPQPIDDDGAEES